MKFLSYTIDEKHSFGFLHENTVHDLSPLGADLRDLLPSLISESDDTLLAAAKPVGSLEDIAFRPPIPNPARLIIIGFNYFEHSDEVGKKDVPEHPMFLAKWNDTMVGQGETLRKPLASDTFDFEGEMAVVIGKAGRRIAREHAYDHVFGYSCFMDGSIREYQGYSPTAGKNFPRTSAFGPWIVRPEQPDKTPAYELRTYLNDELVQQVNTSTMVYDIATIIEHVSEVTPLRPGDVIATGTPGGVGSRRKPPLWLRPGDTIRVVIDGIGELANPVGAESP